MLQGPSLNYYQDFQMIANYAIILECLDLAFYFMMQKIRQKDKSPSWILVFSFFFTSAGIMQLIRVLISTVFNNDLGMISLMNRVNFLIATVTSALIVHFFRDFVKQGSSKSKIFLNACFLLSIIFSILRPEHQ